MNLKIINMATPLSIPNDCNYDDILQQAVAVIEKTRVNAARSILSHTNTMHWDIGKLLFERKLDSKHGDGVVERLSMDLKYHYPKMGLSVSNLWNMKRFYSRFRLSDPKLQQAVVVLPWGHINHLITKLGDNDAAIAYYAQEIIDKGWSRETLEGAVAMEMHRHLPNVNTANNFSTTLPIPNNQYANEVFKDTYNLGFLGIADQVLEVELEKRLVEKIKLFLLELGKGFTYIGNQYPLMRGEREYRVDMLFFHRKLKSLVAIDLKIGEFRPEYIGKMNYYLSLLDQQEKGEGENPSIGLILCAAKDNVDVELALDGFTKPIGVADYQAIIPRQELKNLITREIKSFGIEIKTRK